MIIYVNDKEIEVMEGITLEDYVKTICQQAKGLAVCVNLQVISSMEWSRLYLKVGDRLDILEAVAGG